MVRRSRNSRQEFRADGLPIGESRCHDFACRLTPCFAGQREVAMATRTFNIPRHEFEGCRAQLDRIGRGANLFPFRCRLDFGRRNRVVGFIPLVRRNGGPPGWL